MREFQVPWPSFHPSSSHGDRGRWSAGLSGCCNEEGQNFLGVVRVLPLSLTGQYGLRKVRAAADFRTVWRQVAAVCASCYPEVAVVCASCHPGVAAVCASCHPEVAAVCASCHPEVAAVCASCHPEVAAVCASCHPEVAAVCASCYPEAQKQQVQLLIRRPEQGSNQWRLLCMNHGCAAF
jgi:hypothetical protein